MSTEIYKYNNPFTLESGEQLAELEIGFNTYGRLNKNRDNVVWVCHALTANSDVFDWWKGLFGDNDYFNLDDHFIVCANILGSPYGSSNPLSINPVTGQAYYLSFPQFTVRDIVNAHQLLADYLQITNIEILIGGSLGGQQVIEWGIMEPDRIKNLILVATNAKHSPWGIAFNESQRLAISADSTFYSGKPDGGQKGLKAARSIALSPTVITKLILLPSRKKRTTLLMIIKHPPTKITRGKNWSTGLMPIVTGTCQKAWIRITWAGAGTG